MFTLKKLECSKQACALIHKHGIKKYDFGLILLVSGTEVMINRDSWSGIRILLSEVKFLDLRKTN